jgi:ribosome-binding protein aMBF1 (putative translation factor)
MPDTPRTGPRTTPTRSRRVATNKTRTAPITLRAIRVRLGWTVRELARRAELPPATVSRIERGLMNARPHEISQLEQAIGHELQPLFVLCAETGATT